jgi:uncharacterized protein (DUF58 family)
MLTRRGWSLVGAAIGLFIGGRLLGLVELAVLAVATVLALVGADLWVRLHPPSLGARRSLRERLQVGHEGRVDLTVWPTTRATPTMAISDAFDGGRRAARFLLAPLHEGEEARAAYRFPTDRRGRFEIGPLRATVSDPFGLVERARRVMATEDVVVYPRVHDIVPPPEVGGLDLDRDHPQVRARVEPSGEFLTLREYAPGDDLRHVHWRSTARHDHVMVRQNEARRRAPVLVLLDVRPNAYDHESFERAVEACASIVTALDRAARPCEVVLSTGRTIGTPGRRHLATVMDELAVVQPHGPERLVIATTRRRTSALIAIIGVLSSMDAGALGVVVRDGGTLTAVATTPGVEALPFRSRRIRPLFVPYEPDRSFSMSWNEAVLRWQRSARLSFSAFPGRA